MVLAHIRAAIGSPVQQTNCHPYRHGRWLFVHNGFLNGFTEMHRDLVLAVEPSLFSSIAGSTDSELLFYLALTFGLEDDPIGAVERAVGFVEATAERHGIESPVQMTSASQRQAAVGRAVFEPASGACSSPRTSARFGSCIPTTRGCSS